LTPIARGVEYEGAKGGFPIVAFHDGTPIAKITSHKDGFAVWLTDPIDDFWCTYRKTFTHLADAKRFIELHLL